MCPNTKSVGNVENALADSRGFRVDRPEPGVRGEAGNNVSEPLLLQVEEPFGSVGALLWRRIRLSRKGQNDEKDPCTRS